MKKSLFLLPLVGGFMLSACTFNLFGKEIKLFEKESSSSTTPGSGSTTPGSGSTTPSGDSGSTTPTGGGGGEKGTGLSTVTLYGCDDIVDKSASPLEFTDKGCKVTVGLGGNTNQSLSEAITASKTFEFRIYAKFSVKVEADTEFTKLEVQYSTYKSGSSTYYFDFDVTGAEKVVDNDFDKGASTGKVTYTFSSAVKSYDFGNLNHQARVRSFTFLA